jgi:hypothetical protein
MIRDAPRLAARRRHHVHVLIAVVVAGEGDLRSVGGEAREALLAARRRQPHGGAAALRHDPDVTAVDERDLCRRDGGLAQHARVDLRVQRRSGAECREEQRQGASNQR